MPKIKRKTKRGKIKRYKTRKNKYKTKNNKYKTRKRKKTIKGGAQTPIIEVISRDLEDLRNKIKESTTSEETYVKLIGFDDRGKARLSMKNINQKTGKEDTKSIDEDYQAPEKEKSRCKKK